MREPETATPTQPGANAEATRPPTEPGLGASGLRRGILIRLRHEGPSSPDQLANHLGLSRTGVLQQLHALEAAGLVTHQSVRHGVGRPRHVYDVAEAAQDLFPNNYDGFANGLLAAIRSIGGDELVANVFDERRRLTNERLRTRLEERLPADAPIADRARELAVIQDEQGYLAEVVLSADGSVRLVERNCAIHRVVAGDEAACQAELDLFTELLGTEVVRETHIASGDRCCTYLVGSPTD
jgi:predicted ArsR family transcriptional regulator